MNLLEPTVIAHRGLNHLAPENTLSAFQATADHGLAWVETDVDILADGTVVICHDPMLDRTTNRHGNLCSLTVADLADIDAGSWFSSDFVGERIPTLSAFIDLMNARQLNANIELKSDDLNLRRSARLIENVLIELERLDPDRRVIISSFSHILLAKLRLVAPELDLGFLYSQATLSPGWRAELELVGAQYVHPQSEGLTEKMVDEFRAAGFGVNVWTVNSLARANELFNWGCTGIISDIASELDPLHRWRRGAK